MYKVFIISLLNSGSDLHQKSAAEWLPLSISSCQRYGWNYEIFSAINGYALKESIWKDNGLQSPNKSKNQSKKFIGDLPGAQGCFLSHYMLWNRCVEIDQPIIILEDDAMVIGELKPINSNHDVVKLHQPREAGVSKLGNWSAGAFAYWLSPVGAKKLVDFSKTHGPILADKIIVSSIVNWSYLDPAIVKLGDRVGSSTQPEKYPYKLY